MGDRGSSLTIAPERIAITRTAAVPRVAKESPRTEERADRAVPGTLRLVAPAVDQPPAHVALEQLERVLASGDFDGTPRSRAFLRFIVEETLGGRQEGLTQSILARHVFGRREDFDPTIDPIVRIQAGRLRRSLERYYLLAGTADPVRIELPRGGYAPTLRWASRRDAAAPPRREGARRPDDWPTVVVGPFRAGAVDWTRDETALRFCERLAFEIGRHGDVRVVLQSDIDELDASAHDARASFVLSGHLGQEGAGGRVIARLVDARSARQIWAEELGDAGTADSHDEVARRIAACVASEHGVVARTLWAERRGRSALESTSYDAILRSYQFLMNREVDDLVNALDALARAVEADPDCVLAWVQLARLCTENHTLEASPIETPIERAVSAARHALSLDGSDPRARSTLAHALFIEGDLAEARLEAARALELAPRSYANLETMGWLLTLDGDGERGPALIREVMARNPKCSPMVFQALWAHHLRHGEIEESWRAAQQFRDPASFWPEAMRACSLGHLGRLSEAKDEAGCLLSRKPDFARRGRLLMGRLIPRREMLDRVRLGLGRAGLTLD
jgi:adenylate cyclase